MNFLLHRHLAAAALGSPAAGAGAMLPDLWRMADPKVRAARESIAAEGMLGHVLAGIAHHVDADAAFHASAAFLEGEAATREALVRAPFGAKRMRLFAHVLWELCLDGALVRQEGGEAAVAAVRAGFDAARADLDQAVSLHHFARGTRTAAEREAFEARMARIVAELERGPWIAGYATADGIALRLSGVRARVGLTTLDDDDQRALASAVAELELRADRTASELLADPRYFQATRRDAKRFASPS